MLFKLPVHTSCCCVSPFKTLAVCTCIIVHALFTYNRWEIPGKDIKYSNPYNGEL